MSWSDAARRAAAEVRRLRSHHKAFEGWMGKKMVKERITGERRAFFRKIRIKAVNRLYGSMRNQDKRMLYGTKGDELASMYGLKRAQGRLLQRKLSRGSR